jgi:hypothetical protein
MWSRENARFPGINWGAERGVKDGGAAPFAIRGNADHRIDRYAIRATQTLAGPRVGNCARFINSTRGRTQKTSKHPGVLLVFASQRKGA